MDVQTEDHHALVNGKWIRKRNNILPEEKEVQKEDQHIQNEGEEGQSVQTEGIKVVDDGKRQNLRKKLHVQEKK